VSLAQKRQINFAKSSKLTGRSSSPSVTSVKYKQYEDDSSNNAKSFVDLKPVGSNQIRVKESQYYENLRQSFSDIKQALLKANSQ
jgi:hypothetical protein